MNQSQSPDSRVPPILVVVIDGLGDRAWPVLGRRTPLDAAHTPNLDRLAAAGATGILHPLGPGRAPGTELAHFVLLGYPPEHYPGRVVFEAAGTGFELSPADVAYRALFSRVRLENDGTLTLIEHFAHVDEEVCRFLASRIEPTTHGELTVRLTYTGSRQGVLTISGGADEDITDCDPFFTGHPIAAVEPLREARNPDTARLTAEAVTQFLQHTYGLLREHGPATKRESLFVLLKWIGRKRNLPSFSRQTGMRGVIVGSGILLRGIAIELGLGFHEVPTLPDAEQDIVGRLEEAEHALRNGADFVLAHTKAADEAGHAKDPELKRDVIEAIDRGLSRITEVHLRDNSTVVCVTADHGTPSGTGLIHSGDPVPIVMCGPGIPSDASQRFAVGECAAGSLGHLRGDDFMPVLLNARGTTRYLGARLAATVGLHWPADYPAFRVR